MFVLAVHSKTSILYVEHELRSGDLVTIENDRNVPWCIVSADEHGHDWAPINRFPEGPAPVQYARLGGYGTLLQRAMGRAIRLAPVSQILVTVLEDYRHLWEPSLWFVRPENRFVCEGRADSALTAAAAVLKIADRSPSNVVVILPGSVHVRHELLLETALRNAVSTLPFVPEGVLTLAMLDPEQGIDEDYLVLDQSTSRIGRRVLGMARRPNTWVAHHLRQQGALTASGVVVAYAGALAAHVSKQWPGITRHLSRAASTAEAASAECELATIYGCTGLRPASLRWHAPTLKQRALSVVGCGWNSLRSAQAVARAHEYDAAAVNIQMAMNAPLTSRQPLTPVP